MELPWHISSVMLLQHMLFEYLLWNMDVESLFQKILDY
jgi:hypothetical protein